MYNLVIYLDDEIFFESNISRAEACIGKGSDMDVILKGWNISKNHAKLSVNDCDVFIEDCSSMFGTYVNSKRIVRHGPLKNTDVITIGNYTISIIVCVDNNIENDSHSPNSNVSHRIFSDDQAIKKNEAINFAGEPLLVANKLTDSTKAYGSHQEITKNAITVIDQSSSDKTGDRMPARVKRRSDEYLLFMKWLGIVHAAVLSEMDKRRIDVNKLDDSELRSNVRFIIKEVIKASPEMPKTIDVEDLSRQVLDEAVGLGPLEPLLSDDNVTEIMINKYDEIWIEKQGTLMLSEASFSSDSAVLGAIERIVTPLGRRIDESSPMVDARLKDGSRVNAIIPPLAIRGPSVTIRKFSKRQIGASDYIKYGSLNQDMVEMIKLIIDLRLNIIVSGGTGTGKTTFLNMIGNFVDDRERIVTIEDAAELKLTQPNLISLESRPPNLEGKGMITIRDLVRNSLRMRPDRILVGECRGGEALDMLQAMNTGHDGSMTTLHSNSPRDAMARLEVLVLMAGMNLPVRAIREQIASAVHVVIQLTRFSCGARKVTSISEIVGMEGDVIQMQEIYRFVKTGKDANDKTIGAFEYSGLKPEFVKLLQN